MLLLVLQLFATTLIMTTSKFFALKNHHLIYFKGCWTYVDVIGNTPLTFAATDHTSTNYSISSLIPSWTGSQMFGISFWTNRNSYSDTKWHDFVRLANSE